MSEYDFVRYIIRIFERLKIAYFITGGMAAIAYGEPRYTNDLDMIADLQEFHPSQLLTEFQPPEYYLSEEAMGEAIAQWGQFNIIHTTSGNKVDVIVASPNEYDQLRLRRKRLLNLETDFQAFFAAPEDVILKKMEYFKIGGSEKHLRDITNILLINGDRLDYEYISQWSDTLEITAEWQLIRERLP